MTSPSGDDDTVRAGAASTHDGVASRGDGDEARRIGRYILGEQLSVESGGPIYAARDPQLQREVVVRLLAVPSADAREKVLRDVRAIAKLSHPSLVPIFDVGSSGDDVYIVSPKVIGEPLAKWGKDVRVHELVRRFLQAARGLSAAHDVGVAHGHLTDQDILLEGNNVLVTGFTFESLDESDDPAGKDQRDLRALLHEAAREQPPHEWLSKATDTSWPSVGAFADELEARLPHKKRKFLAVGVVVALMLGSVATVLALAGSDRDPCPDPRRRLESAWSEKLRNELESGFKVAAPSIATGTLARLVPSLDAYAARWRTAQIETCRATHVRRHQPAEVFDRSQACLERRLQAFAALTSVLSRNPTAAIVTRAEEGVSGLPDIGDCERAEQLIAMSPRPNDPAMRARIDAAEHDLDEVQAMHLRGESSAGLDRAKKAVDEARAIAFPPLLARALLLRASFESDNRIDTEATLREAAQVAADARADSLAALAWIRLMNRLATGKGNPAEGQALIPVAEAAVVRAGSPPDLVFEFHLSAGGAHMIANDLAAAEKHFVAAKEHTSDDRRRAWASHFYVKATMLKKGPTAAIPVGEKAVVDVEQYLGPYHPVLAETLDVLAQAYVIAGNFEAAATAARREIEVYEKVFGPRHPAISSPLRVLSHIATAQERFSEARDLARRGLEIAESIEDPNQLAVAHISLAQAIAVADGFTAAKPHFIKGMEILEKVRGKDNQAYIRAENEYASKLAANQQCQEAAPMLEHSIRFFETKRPELTAMPRLTRAQCAEAAGRTAEAIADYERAYADCHAASCEPAIVFAVAGTLGKVLIETRTDRARGARLLNEARTGFESKGMAGHVAETDRIMTALKVKRR